MKALVKAKPEVGLWMQDEPVPEIGPSDVLIRIRKTGICGTDIHIWNWDEWAQRTVPVPMITGHEFAGEIVDIGRNVTDLAIGQLERLHLIVRQGERLTPRPALARFSRPSTSSSPVPRPADADLFSSQD